EYIDAKTEWQELSAELKRLRAEEESEIQRISSLMDAAKAQVRQSGRLSWLGWMPALNTRFSHFLSCFITVPCSFQCCVLVVVVALELLLRCCFLSASNKFT